MSTKIGIIAEDDTDVNVMYELTSKLVNKNKFSFAKFTAHGCGKLRNKCAAWTKNLINKGCKFVIILHDLDNNDKKKLHEELTKSLKNIQCKKYLILIPTYEIEAWLLSDPNAIKEIFNMKKIPKISANPESILDPKKKLRDIVWSGCKKHYVNTIHNKKIASLIEISKLSNSCHSFKFYPEFINEMISKK